MLGTGASRRAVKGWGISREGLESHFVGVLAMLQPTAELLAMLPDIAASNWEQRQARITSEQKQLTIHLNEQKLLNRKAIEAKLRGELSQDDFTAIKQSIEEATANIQEQLKALVSEQFTLADLMTEAEVSVVNLAKTWRNAGINERRELQNTLFPEGLRFSPQLLLFEPGNKTLMASVSEMISALIQEFPPKVNDGRGERI